MTLELTKTELNRLKKQVKSTKKRRRVHPGRTPRAKENRIAKLVRKGLSNSEIKKSEGVGDETINRVKKERGLWGV